MKEENQNQTSRTLMEGRWKACIGMHVGIVSVHRVTESVRDDLTDALAIVLLVILDRILSDRRGRVGLRQGGRHGSRSLNTVNCCGGSSKSSHAGGLCLR